MRIGVISDTHDRYDLTARAVEILRGEGAEALIHCGDLTESPILDLLAGDIPAYLVFGNNDWDRTGLTRHAEHLGIICLGTHGVIEAGGVNLGVCHGDRAGPMKDLEATPDVAYILSGHTHFADDQTVGGRRYVNPGALHRAPRKTVCTIDLLTTEVRFHEVKL